jgi:hypothetical protein
LLAGKSPERDHDFVNPAKAGIQSFWSFQGETLDPGFRRGDGPTPFYLK